MNTMAEISRSQLATVQATIAKDLNANEFSLFIELSKRTGLDPFRRQIIPIVFNKGNEAKRNMQTIVTRDGYRCIASRCGNYRPKSKPAQFVYDEALKDDLNPLGLVSCSVELYIQDKQGEWHPVFGEAYWDEFAPIEDEWAWVDGKRKSTGKKKLADNWKKMQRVMLEKCAESSALRAGWPEEFAGLYGEEEMQKAMAEDLTAAELVNQEIQERRERAVNAAGTCPVDFHDGEGIRYIETGKYADAWLEHIRDLEPAVIKQLEEKNRVCLQEFHAKDKAGHLALKQAFEAAQRQLEA